MDTFTAGQWIQQRDYQSFAPSLIDRLWKVDASAILESLSKADRQLGRLDMYSEYVPDLDLFVQMHVVKEATQSSKIEDTQTEMAEAVLPEEEIAPERRDDWREVNNYIRALKDSIAALDKLPFSTRLLREAHATLMEGARGEHKTPGEYRISQNWIGGSNPSNARFVPPVHDDVPGLMSDLERFAHNRDLHLPPLLKAGIMHYQFETIHPFLDGNGRIGRLMIPLYLVSEGILKQPVLYLSDYLESHREEYYKRLTRVREKDAIGEWLHFFLDGITATAKKGVETFDNILKFQRHWEAEIQSWKPQATAGLALFRFLFTHVAVDANTVAAAAGVSNPTAYKLIERFIDCGLLKEVTGAKRGKVFVFQPYLLIFSESP